MKILIVVALVACSLMPASAQEARRRWEIQRQIRLDKFEQVLPRAMRANGIDMWIVAVKENHYDPLWNDLGRGYVSGIGYYVFTDRGGDRIERAALGPSGYLLNESGAYDIIGAAADARRARQAARPQAHRAEHVRRDRTRRWPVGDDARAPEENAGRHLRRPLRVRREARRRFSLAPRRRGDRGVWRSREHRDSTHRTRALERGDHARQDHARRRGVVDAGSPARSRAGLRVRHALGLHHRPQRHCRDVQLRASSSRAT